MQRILLSWNTADHRWRKNWFPDLYCSTGQSRSTLQATRRRVTISKTSPSSGSWSWLRRIQAASDRWGEDYSLVRFRILRWPMIAASENPELSNPTGAENRMDHPVRIHLLLHHQRSLLRPTRVSSTLQDRCIQLLTDWLFQPKWNCYRLWKAVDVANEGLTKLRDHLSWNPSPRL